MALYLLSAIGPASASTSPTCSASPRKAALPNGDRESPSLEDIARLRIAWSCGAACGSPSTCGSDRLATSVATVAGCCTPRCGKTVTTSSTITMVDSTGQPRRPVSRCAQPWRARCHDPDPGGLLRRQPVVQVDQPRAGRAGRRGPAPIEAMRAARLSRRSWLTRNVRNSFTKYWLPALERAGIDLQVRVHDLRHAHASWLLAGGADLKTVMDRLGHAQIQTTQKYLHSLPDADDKALAAFTRVRHRTQS
jgi:hypothetical protein